MSRFFATELERIRTKLLDERASRAGDVAIGKPKTFEEYNREVGFVRGIDFAIDVITQTTGSGED